MKVKDLLLGLLILSLGVIDVLESNRDAENHVTLKLLCVLAVQEIAGLTELQASLVFVDRSCSKVSLFGTISTSYVAMLSAPSNAKYLRRILSS